MFGYAKRERRDLLLDFSAFLFFEQELCQPVALRMTPCNVSMLVLKDNPDTT